MTLTPFVVVFLTLVFATAGLAVYRKLVTLREDDYLHLDDGEAKLIPQQVATARRLHSLDFWGETLTVLTAVSGLLLVAIYLYLGWSAQQAG